MVALEASEVGENRYIYIYTKGIPLGIPRELGELGGGERHAFRDFSAACRAQALILGGMIDLMAALSLITVALETHTFF